MASKMWLLWSFGGFYVYQHFHTVWRMRMADAVMEKQCKPFLRHMISIIWYFRILFVMPALFYNLLGRPKMTVKFFFNKIVKFLPFLKSFWFLRRDKLQPKWLLDDHVTEYQIYNLVEQIQLPFHLFLRVLVWYCVDLPLGLIRNYFHCFLF